MGLAKGQVETQMAGYEVLIGLGWAVLVQTCLTSGKHLVVGCVCAHAPYMLAFIIPKIIDHKHLIIPHAHAYAFMYLKEQISVSG